MNALLDDDQLTLLIKESITLLCKNALRFDLELAVEGLLGITLDKKNVLLVNIKECIQTATFEGSFPESPLPFSGKETSKETRPNTAKKRKQHKKSNRKVKKLKAKDTLRDLESNNVQKETERCMDEEKGIERKDFKKEYEETQGEADQNSAHATDEPNEAITEYLDDDEEDTEVVPQYDSDTEIDTEMEHSINQELIRTSQEQEEDEGIPLNFKSISSSPQSYRQPSTSLPYSENSGDEESFITMANNHVDEQSNDTAENLKSERISPILITPDDTSKVHKDHRRNLDTILKIGMNCPECDYTSPKKSNLKRHYEGKHMDLRLECHKCSKSFRCKYVLEQHVKSVHTDTGGWICECHGKKFETVKGYRLHIQKEKGELKYKYTCPICGKGQSNEEKHTQHLNTHAGIKPYNCDLCPKSFVSILYLKNHRKRCILGKTGWGTNRCKLDGPVKCGHCDKEFTKEVNMKRHVESKHGNAQFSCPKCERSFQWRASRDRHVRQNMCERHLVLKQDI